MTSNRVQIPAMLAFTIGLPEFLHPRLAPLGPWFVMTTPGFEVSTIFAAVAVLFAHFALRRLAILPLATTKSLILPTLLTIFAVTSIGMFAIFPHAGRYHMWTAFSLSLIWLLAMAAVQARLVTPVVAVIGVDRIEERLRETNVRWTHLREPHLNRPITAAVIDPHAAISLEWSRFITGLVFRGIPVYHLAHLEEGLTGRLRFRSNADNDFGALLPSLAYLRLKRLVDFVGALLLLPFVAPVILIAMITIRLDSPGAALFRQQRVGRAGKEFTCYKLRTMRSDCAGPAFTTDADPRITLIGRFLRKWRIDELPQIANVIRGEMSWIGPRPEAVELGHHYAQHIPFYDYRHAVQPGITGWAAVHQGNVAEIDAAMVKLEYDFYYIRHFSIWLDFLIFLKTLQTILSGFGSK
jgi:lipopolysaccharide/colanic/teichoic acid biosynthesis glycosyltransferase